MACPRPSSTLASVLLIPLTLLAALLVLVMGSAQASSPPSGFGSGPNRLVSPQASINYPAVFVGQDHVDLKWDLLDDWYTTYILLRDDAEIIRFGTTVTFYRDRAVAKGQTYTYKVCAQHPPEAPLCGIPSTVTVGQIRGVLYEYLSWAADTYRLSGEITVQQGATLHIGSGATVVGAWDAEIRDYYPLGVALGAIQVDGATIHARLLLKNGSSWVDGSTIGGDAPGWVDLDSWAGTALSGNIFTSTGTVNIYSASGQALQVHDNTFHAALLMASGAGDVRIHGNRFEKGSTVRIEGEVKGGISGNTFHDSSIGVYSSGYFDINNNRMRLLEQADRTLIGVGLHAPNVGIYGNLLDGFMAGYYGTGVGISAGADQDAGGIVDIHDNIVTELERGISLSGPIRVLIYNNTITHNRTGILAHHWPTINDPNVAAVGNCIAGNLRTVNTAYAGLTTVGMSSTVEATSNYWGDPSGPTHPDNPGGDGDRIQELDMDWAPVLDPGVVNFTGWLSSHPCSEVDLSVAGLEAVQSIQDLNNTVPLVAGKSTVLRIYADSGMAPEVTGVPVELKVSRDGSLLGSKQGTLTARPIVKWDSVRAAADQGLAIRLDSDWLSGTLHLEVTLNAAQAIQEASYDNNQMTYTLGFSERKPLHIGLAPVEYQPLSSVEPRMPVTDDLPILVQFLHKSYPVSKVSVSLLPAVWWPYMMQGSESETERSRALLRHLTYLWSIHNAAGFEPGEGLDQIVAVFPADCEDGGDITFSYSDPRWLGGKGLASYVCNNAGDVLAHEVGHNLGLYHPCLPAQAANCCSASHPGQPQAPLLDWPYASASIQEFGFDAVESAIILPVTPDLMTYCRPRWLSPFHYKKLFQANGAPQPPPPVTPGGSLRQAASGPYLLAGGLVDTAGAVTFDPFWQLAAAQPALEPPEGSEYCLELRDAAHAVLQSRCFDLSFYDYEAGAEIAVDGFVTAMPLAPTASRAVLRQGTVVLGEVVASAHAPQVTLLAPNTPGLVSGKMSVQWTAQDADAGELAFALSYSNDDGASWLPFAVNLTGTVSYEVDLSNLPGGTACRVKVDVSDGWHNASDVSDSSFQVAGKAPLAGILQPAAGAVVTAPLTLQGYGYDLEDGQLAGSSLAWTSDLDGPLGTGDTVWDVELTPGQHTLTLQATDSQGTTGSATVVITVGPVEPDLERVYLPVVLRQD
jgi:hypothetical protein